MPSLHPVPTSNTLWLRAKERNTHFSARVRLSKGAYDPD
jgi:hypothetical protein